MSKPVCGEVLDNGAVYTCDHCHGCEPLKYPYAELTDKTQLDKLRGELHTFMAAVGRDVLRLSSRIDSANAETRRITLVIDDNFKVAVQDINDFKRVVEANFDKVRAIFRRCQ